MPIIAKLPNAYRVNIIESEAGWGSKVDEVIYFDNEAEAKQYAETYNKAHNTLDHTPSWYMYAEYAGQVR